MGTVQHPNLTPINKNIAYLMAQKDLTIVRLSELANIAIGTIQKLMTDPKCNPTLSSLEAIAKALDVSVGKLIGEDIPELTLHNIPAFDWDELNTLLINEVINQERLTAIATKKIEVSNQISKTAFAIKLSNDALSPLFPKDSLLIFDHQRKFYDNAYVLVKTAEHRLITFKQLLIDEPVMYLRSVKVSLQDKHTKLGPNDSIIATLVQSQITH